MGARGRAAGAEPAEGARRLSARKDTPNQLGLFGPGDGPDVVLDKVAERAPEGFGDISEVMSREELTEIAGAYKKIAGFDVERLNARPGLMHL